MNASGMPFWAKWRAGQARCSPVQTARRWPAAFAGGRRAAILSVENGSALEGNLSRLEVFHRDGVRFLTLTWFGENELGFGSLAGGKLKPFGCEVVKKLPEYGIVPDISHLSDEGVAEVFALTDGPLVATHSNVRSQNGHCRNLTNAQIREISARGGLIGLNLCRAFLSENAASAVWTIFAAIWTPFSSLARRTPCALEQILTARRCRRILVIFPACPRCTRPF